MLKWFPRSRVRREPEYASLKLVPTRGFPPAIADMEAAIGFRERQEAIAEELRSPSR